MKKSRKIILTVLCAAALVGASVFGTLAYLTAQTDAVTNTFVVGKLLEDPEDFVLLEHEISETTPGSGVFEIADGAKETDENEYTVLPGVDLPKDPFVRTEDEVLLDAYVFVEIVEDDFGTNLHYTVDTGSWTEMTGVVGKNGGKVYYMNDYAAAGEALEATPILAPNTNGKEITVDNAEISDTEAQFGGSLVFYGYMIQKGDFTDAKAAWNAVYPGSLPPRPPAEDV